MKNFFNGKLYVEGLKRIRLTGIIFGVITVLFASFPALAALIGRDLMSSFFVLEYDSFAVPIVMMLFFTPAFFLSMFSFLNKRKGCDFYHSIPHTRGCIFNSFLAAILTWILGILVVAVALTTLLWSFCPNTTFSLSLIPLSIGITFVGCIYVGGFTILALSLTGTSSSNFVVTMLLMFVLRICGYLGIWAIKSETRMFDVDYSVWGIFTGRNWYPAAVFSAFDSPQVFQNASLWILASATILACYGLAFFAFKKRRSEMANKSAPGPVLQCIFRCAFTLPIALATTVFLLQDMESAFLTIFVIITLAVFFLYELVTAKKVKTALKSMWQFVYIIVCCIVFCCLVYGTIGIVHSGNYTADEIESISLYNKEVDYYDYQLIGESYEGLAVLKTHVDDRRAKEIIQELLEINIRYEESDHSIPLFDFGIPRIGYKHVEIKLKSGRVIGRRLCFSEELFNELSEIVVSSEEGRAAYLSLPKGDEISNFFIPGISDVYLSEDEAWDLWGCFIRDYEKLSPEEQKEYKDSMKNMSWGKRTYIGVSGRVDGRNFRSKYYVPASFEETNKMLYSMLSFRRAHAKAVIEAITYTKSGELWKELPENVMTIELTCKGKTYTWRRNQQNHEALYEYRQMQELSAFILPFIENDPTMIEEVFIKYDSPVGTQYIGFTLGNMNAEEREKLEYLLSK